MFVGGIVEEFAKRRPEAVVLRGGTTLIEHESVGEIIDEAERRGLRILGLEGFLIDDDGTYPSLERLWDFSECNDRVELASASRALLEGPWSDPPRPGHGMSARAHGRSMVAIVLDE